MSDITELQARIRDRALCPWCGVAAPKGGIGGMKPFEVKDRQGVRRYWHEGCLADYARYELEAAPEVDASNYTRGGSSE